MSVSIEIEPSGLTEGQREFLYCGDPSALLSGGFGAGKTIGGIVRLLRQVAENPGVPGLVLAPNWRTLWSVTHRSLRKVFQGMGALSVMPKVIDRQNECYLDFWGTPVFLRSAKNVDSYDGLDVGWLLGDEVRHWTRRAYDVAIGRVRVKCPLPFRGFTSTPQMNWMAEEFNMGHPGRRLIRAPTRQNAVNLAPGYVEGLRASYSHRMQRAVLEGLFTILEGAVYEYFDPDPRTSASLIDYDPCAPSNRERKCFLGIDPGYRSPAVFWAHEITPTQWVIFDEIIAENISAVTLVDRINQRKINGVHFRPDEIWVDPAANSKAQTDASDVTSALKKVDTRGGLRRSIFWVAAPYNAIEYGVDKVRVMLGEPEHGVEPRIKFAKRLLEIERGQRRGIVKDVAAYQYPEVKDGRPLVDTPLKDGVTDHFNDALRYFAVGRWLRSPLKSMDPTLANQRQPGYKQAA